ncbi:MULTISPECIES: tRNA (adenosine(37)-N6)-threonylcarbamoyltransferase complex dimerization subunit type 1 TsaB [Rhodomicrobium]|uniref:tRNA (adenosine(37)-N6)-threonylcarbamoyltransferase complex dimerization subunit type 1 TsaB n=1 Tax=Rhodomicrobium TaxID=1068 RepID=UPI000B4BA121|nr:MULTISPECIES: tRNA (adenosine(37)-N6)-threonylcarbamoyltransferase complex dimerization subunit type 1 TsaB [Rhodomicrobium]
MTLLAIDTSMTACSAALLRAGAAGPVQRFEPMERGHAEAIFPMIEAVMAEAGCRFADLTRIAVTVGPGSFTGVRAGVAAARGLAVAAGLPVIGVNSLEVMARGCLRRLGNEEGGFAIAHDAKRGEFYVQHFAGDGAPLSEPQIMDLAQAAASIPASVALIAGSGAAAIAEEAGRRGREIRALFPVLLPEAGDLALIASAREPDARPPAPLYLRPADAKPQTDKSLARAG